MSAPFSGVAGEPTRNQAQQDLSKVIGNESTRPRSIELAIRIENALFERVGKKVEAKYSGFVKSFVEKFTDPRSSFDLNSRLLTGILSPDKFVEEEVPEEEPEYVPAPKKKVAPVHSAPAPVPVPAPQPIAQPVPQPIPQPVSTQSPLPSSPIPIPASSAASSSASSSSSSNASPRPPEMKSKTQTSSYYYFSSTDPELAKKYAPVPINPDLVNEPPQSLPAVGDKSVSKWNAGGTYEERDVSAWARARLAELLGEASVPEFADGSALIAPWKVTGEATAVFTRGKKRVGYELNAKSTFSGSFQSKSVTGNIEIPSLDNSCGFNPDFKINVTTAGSSEQDEVVRRAVNKIQDAIRQQVDAFLKELADK